METVHVEYEQNVKFINKLIIFQCKGLVFYGYFQQLLLCSLSVATAGEEDYRKGAGDFYFSSTLFVLLGFFFVFVFATCKNYFYKLKKKLFSISKLPNTVVKERTYFLQKKISMPPYIK